MLGTESDLKPAPVSVGMIYGDGGRGDGDTVMMMMIMAVMAVICVDNYLLISR